jgi:tetratricopeptide (TPR) repeat protein
MTTNKPTGKTPTSETTRVPSTVPNDLDHLGVPASVDLRLRKRRARRQGIPNWLKAAIAIGSALVAFGLVMLVIFIIAFPSIFRGMEPRYQQRIMDMNIPVFDGWIESLRPTPPFEVLPTLGGGSGSDAAQQLLLTDDAPTTPTGTPQAGDTPQATISLDDQATQVPTITPASEGIPVGMAATPEPTPLPVYASPTPDTGVFVPTWTPVYIPTEAPLPKVYRLNNIRYEAQGWNNCGPTTMTMALSYYGWTSNQEAAAGWMKPNSEDKNVSPWQMVRFVNEVAYQKIGVKALYRVGGNITVLKSLLAHNFPVMIEESIQPEGEGWMGHYVLMIGYDDAQQRFLTYDSFLGYNQGDGRPSPYSVFDEHWRHFNRVFLVLYPPERESDLRNALGDFVDPAYGYRTALELARSEAGKNPDDEWAWFNMGSSYVGLQEYDNAAIAYDQAIRLGLPFRMLWYQFGPYEAYYHVGDYNNVRALAQNTIATTKYVEESYYWIGMSYAAEGSTSAAIQEFDLALTYNRNFFPAQEAKAQVQAGTFTVAQTGS